MRVKDCEKCKHCKRRVWSSYHIPQSYHAIGMSHAYAYCDKHGMRVSEVRGCKELETRGGVQVNA